MRYPTLLLLAAMLATGCSYQRMGSLTMVSTRNVDSSKDYQLLARQVEASAREQNDDALQQAIDAACAMQPGGEYLMNVVVYMTGDGKRVKVVGDVWGTPTAAGIAAPSQTGSVAMKVGDRVAYKVGTTLKNGTIIGIRNTEAVIEEVRPDGTKKMKEVELERLTKLD